MKSQDYVSIGVISLAVLMTSLILPIVLPIFGSILVGIVIYKHIKDKSNEE